MNDKIKNVHLQIGGMDFPVKPFDREYEQIVREAAKQVNIRLDEYRSEFKELEPEKWMTMVAYRFSLEKLLLMQRNDTSPYVEKVKELNELLEDYLKEK